MPFFIDYVRDFIDFFNNIFRDGIQTLNFIRMTFKLFKNCTKLNEKQNLDTELDKNVICLVFAAENIR